MAKRSNETTRWWQRSSGRIIAEVDVLCGVAIIAILASPSLAATLIPVPLTNFTINVGDLPIWITTFVITVTWWEARSARKKDAAKAQEAATTALAHIEVVRAQTDGLLDKVAAMAKTAGEVVGHEKAVAEVAAAKEVVRVDAVADAQAAADIRAIESNSNPSKAP